MMILDFLPKRLLRSFNKLNEELIYDIRLRTGYPIKVNYGNVNKYLTDNGVCDFIDNSLICSKNYIDEIVNNVTENSFYAFNGQIVEGYLTTNKGVRIGIAGQCVFESGKIVTVKNINSLNIRVPHEIKDCSKIIYDKIFKNKIYNTLIVSPPERGKTTILKDLVRKINAFYNLSVLIIDERGEFESVKGVNIDSIKFSDKLYAFNYGLRSLSPNVVVTDELSSKSDFSCVEKANNSGVKIIASCHAECVEDLSKKEYYVKGVFERIVVLKSFGEIGKVENFYDGDFNLI